jgi:hypothetical protein
MPTHHSPAVPPLLKEISQIKKPVILDLGANCTSVLDFFAQRRCKLYFEDLPAAIKEFDQSDIGIDQCLLDYGETQFDLVLAWDVLNYLSLSEIKSLMDKVNHHCRPNTLFHMIRYMGKYIPTKPRRFQLCEEGQIWFDAEDSVKRQDPAHSTVKILQQFTDHSIENTFMNDLGMQEGFVEHLSRYKSTCHRRKMNLSQATTCPDEENHQSGSNHYYSPAMESLYAQLKLIEKPKILIIGPRSGRHYGYFNAFSQDICIEDLYSALQWHSINKENRVKGEQFENGGNTKNKVLSENTFSYPPDTRFDAVIAWDIFNYCQPEQIKDIGKMLSRLCSKKSWLYFMSYTKANIPTMPGLFSLTDKGWISVKKSCNCTPRLSSLNSSSLVKLLPQFYVKKICVNQNNMLTGVCEYLAQYSEHVS